MHQKKMELKKFKDFKPSSQVVEKHEANGTMIEVKKLANDHFVVSIDGLTVEQFKTLDAAQEAAADAIEAMGLEE